MQRLKDGVMKSSKLQEMYRRETASDDWWNGLSAHERETYVKAHPRSKHVKGGARSDNHSMARKAHGLSEKHGHLDFVHENRALDAADTPLEEPHVDISEKHSDAAAAYLAAAGHFKGGRTSQGHAALEKGHRIGAGALAAAKAQGLAEKHGAAADRRRKASKAAGDKDGGDVASHHKAVGQFHHSAAKHYGRAVSHFIAGDHKKGEASMRRGKEEGDNASVQIGMSGRPARR